MGVAEAFIVVATAAIASFGIGCLVLIAFRVIWLAVRHAETVHVYTLVRRSPNVKYVEVCPALDPCWVEYWHGTSWLLLFWYFLLVYVQNPGAPVRIGVRDPFPRA